MYIQTKHIDEEAVLRFGQYHDGSKAISVLSEIGEPLMTATVCLDSPPKNGNVYIKDYSENQGILNCLLENGVIGEPVGYIKSGFVEVAECPLLEPYVNAEMG